MSNNNKRQRTTTSTESLYINDLPDGILVGISSYLAKPSVVLFALSMNSNSEQQTETSKAIISAIKWNVLDFSVIEKSLAAKLSDDDVDKILKSIDAVNDLKILKLAGCVSITGSGLDVLRSSVAIQQIDLSLVGKHESPIIIEPEPLISEDAVIPILSDIISRGRASSLEQLEFPKKWRNRASDMTQFFDRYNDYLTNQKHCCSKCEQIIDRDDWVCLQGDDWYGTQNYTCSGCFKHFCDEDSCILDEDGHRSGNMYMDWCIKCEKEYCKSCVAMTECSGCDDTFCNKCEEMKRCGCLRGGFTCTRNFCGTCFEKRTCSYCGFCFMCSQKAGTCKTDGCQKTICSQCDIIFTAGAEGYCKECGL